MDALVYPPFSPTTLCSLPLTSFTVAVDVRPVPDRDGMSSYVQYRLPTPVRAEIIPHGVEAGDVLYKCYSNWVWCITDHKFDRAPIS